jgi:hypothetical protein
MCFFLCGHTISDVFTAQPSHRSVPLLIRQASAGNLIQQRAPEGIWQTLTGHNVCYQDRYGEIIST